MAISDFALSERDAAVAASCLWVASLDRERLGTFAMDAELLAWTDSSQRLFVNYSDAITDGSSVFDDAEYSKRLNLFVVARSRLPAWRSLSERGRDRLLAELYHWWTLDATAPTMTIAVMPETRVWWDRYPQIYSNPDFHSFYEADIWDDGFIASCIADGTDVSMAKRLLEVA